MQTWLPERDQYLDELVRWEGHGSFFADRCAHCPQAPAGRAVFRCLDCSPGPLSCAGCLVGKHSQLPYHRIQRWTGQSFETSALCDAGLSIQLGHADGSACSNPIAGRKDFCAIDINGRHNLHINFCGCDHAADAGNLVQQLMRFDLYPATHVEPNTAFTFRMLEHYHIQSLQGKISMFDYYQSLERLTDNTGTRKLQDRYKAFMRVVAQWRHLKMLKRGGRAHDPSGVAGTLPGQLAIGCPACPRPGINIPDNWDTISDDLKYLYVLSVAIDACFRLKRRAVSDEHKDPILGSGWGYFVEDSGYREILTQYAEQKEMSTCSGLAAIDHANTKYHKGYAATGVGAVICSRHEFMLANGVGDTQVGERYINMDYIFVSAMLHHLVVNKLITYDIACQWSKGLVERISKFPAHMQINLPEDATFFGIPKLHYHSHKSTGHSIFSLNYRLGAGRLDGEGIERRWWWIQPIANSTKVMGPGGRQGMLEDQWGYANWRKFVMMPWTLRDRLILAWAEYHEHKELFDSFTVSLIQMNIAQWKAAVEAWEKDQSLPDPYEVKISGPTQAHIRKEISEEESKASAATGYIPLHDVSPSGFITTGIDLEEHQRRIRREAAKATASKLPALVERRHALRRRLVRFRELQAVYMPAALPVLAEDPAARLDVEQVENVRLGLPSDIADSHRSKVCSTRLQEIEARLREAQCRDALQDLRNKLHSLAHLYKYKKLNVRHQGANTRAHADLNKQEERKRRAAERYRRARRAKLSLSGRGPWENELRELLDDDIRHLSDDDPGLLSKKRKRDHGRPGLGEGRKKISWIWKGADTDGNAGETDSLRVEWLKSRARWMRWHEETKLLPEEMRRCLATLLYEEQEWIKRATARAVDDPRLREGLVAYALDQAAIRRRMRSTFRTVCLDAAQKAGAGSGAEWELVAGQEVPLHALPEVADDMMDITQMYELDGEDLEMPQWA
ncbi:hypothetical protein K466DRAFT_501978 [Polyporus arcularius HHB13444]|uniref:CxC2-like cysteine cluster KDZ transposase-associated domain-containing protein n=1 Tax=Polyporus arcularius HHB13444 TaxID=1314778 RepID=A0A5C3NVM5_9APHY|nr:hypothetical protein K466DRAFT_501978 [Polyporus arcularius HHB13444]